MANTPELDTVAKVAAKSKVGFGTVQRISKGEGNPTLKNLLNIARVFKRAPEQLWAPTGVTNVTPIVRETQPVEYFSFPPALKELTAVAQTMSERGQIELIGRAKELALQYPKAR